MIGVSCPEFSAHPFEVMLEKVSKEFKHWEIFAEGDHSIRQIYDGLKVVGGSYDLSYSIHTPISDTNIGSLTDRMRESSVLEMISTAEVSVELGISMITVHPGLVSFSIPGMEKRAIENAKKSLRMLDRVSSEYGVTFAIENMSNFPPMLGKTAEDLNELVDGTNLGICFDIGHANTTGQMELMVSTFKDRIVNVHIHDNSGASDEHLTIGEGNIDFPKVLGSLSWYNGNYIIESKSLESAIESKKRLTVLLE